jgi:hypothetical protein
MKEGKLQLLAGERSPRANVYHALPFEKHYSAKEVAALWNLSPDFIRDLFRDEPGVLLLSHTGNKKYATLRIPESVMLRVYAMMVRKC